MHSLTVCQDTYSITWHLNVIRSSAVWLHVTASGLVHSRLPQAPWNTTVYMPGYAYDDAIGVAQSTQITVTAKKQ